MEITEVRIKLMEEAGDRLQAFCSITIEDAFVIRDLKIIDGAKGPFVAMPSRKLTDRCPRCRTKNHLRALYCNQCGARLGADRAQKDPDGRARLHADIAHPINSACREMIQSHILRAYEEERERSKQPGYVCTYDDYGEESFAELADAGADDYVDMVQRVDPSEQNITRHPQGPHRAPSDTPARRRASESAVRRERPAGGWAGDDDAFAAGIM